MEWQWGWGHLEDLLRYNCFSFGYFLSTASLAPEKSHIPNRSPQVSYLDPPPYSLTRV